MSFKIIAPLYASLCIMGLMQTSVVAQTPRPVYCSFNEKTFTWRIGNLHIERIVEFDKSAGALRTHTLKTGPGFPTLTSVGSGEGELWIKTGDGKSLKLQLDHDWTFGWQTVATPPNSGRALTIHLTGVRSYSGYEIEANYEIQPGESPYFSRSLTFINRGDAAVTVEKCLYDRLSLSTNSVPAKKIKTRFVAPPRTAAFSEISAGAGMLSDIFLQVGGVASVDGGMVTLENSSIVTSWSGKMIAPRGNGRAFLPETVVFAFKGVKATGSDLLDRYRNSKTKK